MDTWEVDILFLRTVRTDCGFLQNGRKSREALARTGGILTRGMEELGLFCWLPQEVVGWSPATGFPVQHKLAQCVQNILIWWRAGSVAMC
jgi:hypothetical protein